MTKDRQRQPIHLEELTQFFNEAHELGLIDVIPSGDDSRQIDTVHLTQRGADFMALPIRVAVDDGDAKALMSQIQDEVAAKRQRR